LGFNYRKVMEDKAIYAGIRGGQDHAVWAMSENRTIHRLLYQWRETLKSRIDCYVHTTEAQGILHALLLGDSRSMDQEVMQSYSRSGTIHILAVSGLHVGMIYLLISFVFGKLLLRNSWPIGKMVIQAVLLWGYAGLTGFSPSVSRSAVMCSFFIVASTGNKQSNAINTLAASAVLQAAHDPLCLLSLGFQLSYLAVLGILLLQSPIESLLYFRNRTLLSVWKLSSVSIAAQFTTLPLTVCVFRQFPVYFLLANLVMIPISTVILYIGVLFLCVSGIPPAAAIAGKTMEFLVGVMNAAATQVSALPGALLSGFHLDTASAVVITLLIAFLADFLITKKKSRIFFIGGLMTALVGWSTAVHLQHTRLREVLLTETRDGLTLVYTSDGRSHLWTQSPGEAVQPMHPLEPYLSYLGTTVKYGLLELPEQAIWTKITPPNSTDTLLVVLPKINDVRLELNEWKRVSHHPVVFSSKVRRGVQKYLTSQAADSTRILGNLRETSWVFAEGRWRSSLEVYPP
jgi:competence protein ComEC